MTTQEVANRYCELASQSKWIEIQDELHDDKVICKEPEHTASRGVQVTTIGRDAVKAKGRPTGKRSKPSIVSIAATR